METFEFAVWLSAQTICERTPRKLVASCFCGRGLRSAVEGKLTHEGVQNKSMVFFHHIHFIIFLKNNIQK